MSDQELNLKTELEVLLPEARIKVETEDNEFVSAKANCNEPISMQTLEQVADLCFEQDLTYNIKRSGAGVVLEFKKAD